MSELPQQQQIAFDAFMENGLTTFAIGCFAGEAQQRLVRSLALAAFVAGQKFAIKRCEREHGKR